MKIAITKSALEEAKEKYGNFQAVSGYVEEDKKFFLPLPKYYLVVVDRNNLTLSQLDIKLDEKSVEVISLKNIKSIKVTGRNIRRVSIVTKNKTIKLIIKPRVIGIKEYQRKLISKLESLSK